LLPDAGEEIHYLPDPPFPLTEFTLKSPRVRYVAGNKATCEALSRIIAQQ